jgi:intracellular sulfur oxidation DsrE/DsrF family protein
MNRMLLTIVLLCGFALAVWQARPSAGNEGDATAALRAVIHINFSDAEAQGRGLENIENIFKQVGDDATIEVVCHGPGINLLVKDDARHAKKVQELIERQVRFVACENTMRKKSLSKDDLLDGVTTVPSGTVEVLRKQQQGFAYFKP